ncbi:MAG TPA: 8-oxoguanine deaminase [Anaerolineales bacterium]|jgi:8-oxoguanine deaminase|nr:8-oxoguanine deaminase [Anaerolineales bacterium]HQX17076.1 8-oxoguanine deaminase [Anaerolineales bacterium]
MPTLLIKNAHLLTMDDHHTELSDGGLFIRDGFIEQVGQTGSLHSEADEVLDLKGHVLLPGLVNTHHHFYQTLTRAVSAAQDANLFNWLKTLYPIWARLTPHDIFTSTQTALAELALSGCTTASDHLYLYPNGSKLDDEIAAAAEVGLRLHASRGSMSLGESKGGLPPDSVVDDEESILKDSQRIIQKYHDAKPGSMVQIVLAPCSPFSVTGELMKQSAKLAREYGVHLHTHLAETEDEEQFCLEKFGHRPVGYMQEVDWVGGDVWFAHAVWVNDEEIKVFAKHNCGVAHCPTSNMRLASGIAPIKEYRKAGVNVGLGVDGSASNDGSHLLAEVRNAMLLSRVKEGITGFSASPVALSGESGANADEAPRKLMTAREALHLGTRGGAAVLGRKDIGSLEVGNCADFFAVNLNKLGFAGMHDPVSAIVFGQPGNADYTVVGGKFIVKEGQLVTVDEHKLIEKHNQAAKRLLS